MIDPRHEQTSPRADTPYWARGYDLSVRDPDRDANHDWARFVLRMIGLGMVLTAAAIMIGLASFVFVRPSWPAEMPRGPFLGGGERIIPYDRSSHPQLAKDQTRWSDISPKTRAWFQSVKTKDGVSCCDIADGHRTEYDMHDGAYWVPIEGKWLRVPDEAVLKDAGNPVGEAIVWYSIYSGAKPVIRCFVPGNGA